MRAGTERKRRRRQRATTVTSHTTVGQSTATQEHMLVASSVVCGNEPTNEGGGLHGTKAVNHGDEAASQSEP